MRIAHSKTTPWTPVAAVRGGTINFKTLLEGQEGRPDNYQLLLADTDVSFKSPRHRHNFDQLRFSVRDATNIGVKHNLEEGDLAYFPEGTYYGPQNQEEVGRNSLAMVIQFGGPSGNGYMSRNQLETGFAQLKAVGDFEGGVYRRHTPAEDGRKNQDAYEAIWELQNGRPVEYARPRFMDPIHFREKNFPWLPAEGYAGVALKPIGTFTERDVQVHCIQLDAGASYTLPAQTQRQLLFFKSGTGRWAAGDEWFEHTAVDVAPGESAGMTATTLSEAVVLRFPRV
jgi:hypothetical protein